MSHPDTTGGRGDGAAHLSVDDAEVKSYQELWLALSPRDWTSMVLVPTEPGASVERVAKTLAEVGRRLSPEPVTAVTPNSLAYGAALALADLPFFVGRRRLAGPVGWPTIDLAPSASREPPGGQAEPAPGAEPAGQAIVLNSSARLIISVPAVVSEPLGLATTQAADLVFICIELGRTRIENARRTLKLIGTERVAGCFLLR